MEMALLAMLGFLMGWAVGLIQGLAKEKELAQELEWVKEKVAEKKLVTGTAMELPQSKNHSEWVRSEESIQRAVAKGWGWVLGVEGQQQKKHR